MYKQFQSNTVRGLLVNALSLVLLIGMVLSIKAQNVKPPNRDFLVGGAPLPPGNLAVVERTGNTIIIQWRDNSNNETGFTITRQNTSMPGVTKVRSTDVVGIGRMLSFTDRNLLPGRYCYTILAYNDQGRSSRSNQVCVTIPATPQPLLLLKIVGQDVPPPLGPPETKSPETKQGVLMIILRAALWEAGQEVIDSTNARLGRHSDIRARVSWANGADPTECGYDCVRPPRMSSTKYPDLPNEKFAIVSARLSFFVDNIQKSTPLGWVSVPVSRTIHTNVDIRVYCKGWMANNGQVKAFTQVHRPWIDQDHSLFEDIINIVSMGYLSNFIDAQVARQLRTLPAPTGSEFSACNSLGVLSHYPNEDQWQYDRVVWDPGPSLPGSLAENAKVTIKQIKRLQVASDVTTADDLSFTFFVNGRALQYPTIGKLYLQENESVELEGMSIVIPISSDNETLQVIVNSNIGAAEWAGFDRDERFGNGIQTIRTSREVVQSFPVRKAKIDNDKPGPVVLNLQEFEITYEVEFRGSVVRQ